MFAVVQSGGKQYTVKNGDVIEVERISGDVGAKVSLEVLMKGEGEKVSFDKNAKCEAEIVAQGKGKKITIFKYKAKKNDRVKKGHRQLFTKLKIVSI